VKKNAVLVIEYRLEAPWPAASELASGALHLTGGRRDAVLGVVVGLAGLPAAEIFAARTGMDVLCLDLANPEAPTGEIVRAALAEVLREITPTYLFLSHQGFGPEVGPALAAQLGAACLTGVDGLETREGQFLFRRPMYGGKLAALHHSLAAMTVLTVQPGAFRPVETDDPAASGGDPTLSKPGAAKIKCLNGGALDGGGGIRCRRLFQAVEAESDLAEATVVVAVGRGLGGPENLPLIERLAAWFAKAAVAGSRPVCDDGWLPYRRQVGQTGATVRPKVYLACGISGAAQHLAGMREAGLIVAVNRDPRAAIFQAADLGIVEDLHSFLPLLLAEAEGRGE